jgi:hypothetical protein
VERIVMPRAPRFVTTEEIIKAIEAYMRTDIRNKWTAEESASHLHAHVNTILAKIRREQQAGKDGTP